MEYLRERLNQLRTEIREFEKDMFNPAIRPKLDELRARENELFKAIRTLEHCDLEDF